MTNCRELCEAMYSALKNLGCRCEHNVPYAGGRVPQVVTRQCARCKAIDEYEAITIGPTWNS